MQRVYTVRANAKALQPQKPCRTGISLDGWMHIYYTYPAAINGIHASFAFGSIVKTADPTARARPPPKMMAALTDEDSTSVDRRPSNAMTSSEERTSAESERSRLPHREATDKLSKRDEAILYRGRSNPSATSNRFSLGRVSLTSNFDTDLPCRRRKYRTPSECDDVINIARVSINKR